MMKKKGVKKKTAKKSSGNINVEKALIENFVSLQKVMTNLIVSFDELSGKISKLLDLFEISAKTLAEKDFNFDKGSKKEQEISEKLGSLLEQNKVIARGLTLLHDVNPEIQQMQQPPIPQKNAPSPQNQKKSSDMGEYQKSISYKP